MRIMRDKENHERTKEGERGEVEGVEAEMSCVGREMFESRLRGCIYAGR